MATKLSGKVPDFPSQVPSSQFSSILDVKSIISPALNGNSPSFSASNSNIARQQGLSGAEGGTKRISRIRTV